MLIGILLVEGAYNEPFSGVKIMSASTAKYKGFVSDPSQSVIDIDAEKSDTVELSHVTRGIYVGVTGDIVIQAMDDSLANARTFKAVPAGTILPVRARLVKSTNTTATGLLGLI